MMPAPEELARDFLSFRRLAPVVRLEGAAPAPLGRSCVAIGAFDGMHAGHHELLCRLIEDARDRGARACVVTFDPDPDCVVGPGPAPKLMDPADRLRALAASGVDAVVVVPFTSEVAALDHVRFFEDILLARLDIASVHVGGDFKLGRGGCGTVDAIRAWGAGRSIEVFGHHLVRADGEPVSATRIRSALAAGHVEGAAGMLGRRFAVRGRVAAGRGEGTGFGFPTANIEVAPDLQMPADGVYAGLLACEGTAWPAAVNVGLPPTFADEARSAHLEANLLGFSGDLYGRDCMLAFDRFLRPSVVFRDTDELVRTVLHNIDQVREEFGEAGARFA